jgi:hypothetical protein
MTNRGYFVSGVFATLTIGSMVSMFHTLWIVENYQAPEYSNIQLLGLLIGTLGSFLMLYLWDTTGRDS